MKRWLFRPVFLWPTRTLWLGKDPLRCPSQPWWSLDLSGCLCKTTKISIPKYSLTSISWTPWDQAITFRYPRIGIIKECKNTSKSLWHTHGIWNTSVSQTSQSSKLVLLNRLERPRLLFCIVKWLVIEDLTHPGCLPLQGPWFRHETGVICLDWGTTCTHHWRRKHWTIRPCLQLLQTQTTGKGKQNHTSLN